jgi:twitching motility two-component system response regulator PilH
MAEIGLFKRLFGNERRGKPRTHELRGARILIVDDSATIRAVLGKMLGQDGYAVLKAEDGEQALAMAREERPDLVFLDIVLPGMSGFAVLRALRHDPVTRDIPVVMISGNIQATEQFYVQRFGADDFLKKPFGRGEVFARLRKLGESGRFVLRHPVTRLRPSGPALSAAESAVIPDIALPDPAHQELTLQAGRAASSQSETAPSVPGTHPE